MAPPKFGELGLSILGLGTQYPPYSLKPNALDTLSKRFYQDSPAMTKVLAINRYTGIDQRSSVGTPEHPLVNQATAPTIGELHAMFLSDGVPLAVSAARQALAEAGVTAAEVTHMVSTTCTDSANPGYDHFVAAALGLGDRVEKTLLHGVGCSGGMATLRTAAGLALGHAARGLKATVLCVALEVSTTMVRSELESIDRLQETRIGVALFSDCAGAAVVANSVGLEDEDEDGDEDGEEMTRRREPVYELLGWDHRTIPETEQDLGFDVDPLGWKVVLSTRVPKLTAAVLQPAFADLIHSTSALLPPPEPAAAVAKPRQASEFYPRDPATFDWAMHPGGATILSGAERALGITPQHMRASYDTYVNHGNSSSATIFSVLNRLRRPDMDALAPAAEGEGEGTGGGVDGGAAGMTVGKPKEHVVACAFGPGIAVEMAMLRRPGLPGAKRSRTRRRAAAVRTLGGGVVHAAVVNQDSQQQQQQQPSGLVTPPETESEGSRSENGEVEVEVDDGTGVEGQTESVASQVATCEKLDVRSGAERDEHFISEALDAVELD